MQVPDQLYRIWILIDRAWNGQLYRNRNLDPEAPSRPHCLDQLRGQCH